ncbi:hypothetical protein VNO77_07486 [Canavalia gladiata]|uniref:Uncharacterized protein n=1 Tax=Canavalia gladiata TaxID=3824 RepID=A0AAN9MDC0_CANGL
MTILWEDEEELSSFLSKKRRNLGQTPTKTLLMGPSTKSWCCFAPSTSDTAAMSGIVDLHQLAKSILVSRILLKDKKVTCLMFAYGAYKGVSFVCLSFLQFLQSAKLEEEHGVAKRAMQPCDYTMGQWAKNVRSRSLLR